MFPAFDALPGINVKVGEYHQMIKLQLEGYLIEYLQAHIHISRVGPDIGVPNDVQDTGKDQKLHLYAFIIGNSNGDYNEEKSPEYKDRIVVFGPWMPGQAYVFVKD